MVNGPSETAAIERGSRSRQPAEHAAALGSANLNPFGDLHMLQHLSARLARSLRGVFEPILRQALRSWAEPVVVQRFADYVAERGSVLTGWLPMTMEPGPGPALLVIEGRFALQMLDIFFGGTGEPPHPLPAEFSPAAETMIRRVGNAIAGPLQSAWEPIARTGFTPGQVELNPSLISDIDGDDPMVITRFGIVIGSDKPTFIDIAYPVAALKPHGPSLTAKVHRSSETEPKWRNGLTRSVMGVRFPVRCVLAEPALPIGRLLELKEGDVIPISFGPQVPVMIGGHRFATGTVGTSNGKAAVRINKLEMIDEEDFQ